MRVHLVDGTYELFRHHFGRPTARSEGGDEIGATRGVVTSVLSMLAAGDTTLGVATDHVIESFRNERWPGYKTSAGVPPELLAQFELLETALSAMGVVVWPMIEREADDALGSAAAVAAADPVVDQVVICTPDKDLAQCVSGRRVVQLDRRSGTVTDEEGVRHKYGVSPPSIPDFLGLVGDSADGFPGLSGWGRRSAAVVLAHYGHIADIPDDVSDWDGAVRAAVRGAPRLATTLAAERELAGLFCDLATLRLDPPVLTDVGELTWSGPTGDFAAVCDGLGPRARPSGRPPWPAAEDHPPGRVTPTRFVPTASSRTTAPV